MPGPLRVAMGVLLCAAGCAGAAFDGTTYRGDGYMFRIPRPPATWQRLEIEDAGLAFRDRRGGGTIALAGRCGDKADDVPLASLTQHLFIQFTDREIVKQEVVPLDGREAMHTVLVAKLDGVPKKFDVWVMKKDGCVYDLYYIAALEHFEPGANAFGGVVRGFKAESMHVGD